MIHPVEGSVSLSTNRLRFEAIADELRSELRGGGLAVGSRLPAERELCLRFGVSRGTIRRALSQLRDLGLIRPAARGWIVTEPLVGEPNALLSFSEIAAEAGATASSDVLAARFRRVSPDEAVRLDVSLSSEVFELTRLRRLDGVPIGIEVTRIRQDIAARFGDADFRTESLYALVRAAGTNPSRADYVVEAAIVSEWEASVLEIAPGSAALVTSATTYDGALRPFELSRSLFRADRYRFRASLHAEHSASSRRPSLSHNPEGGSS